jgi:hypothetical protein
MINNLQEEIKGNIDKWLRNEAEDLEKQITNIENKIKKIFKKEDLSNIDKITELNIKIRELRAAQSSLYMMIGSMSKIEGLDKLKDVNINE